MKYFVFFLVFIVGAVVGGAGMWWYRETDSPFVSPIGKILERPLEQYGIERLGQRTFVPSEILLGEATATTSAYTVYTFHYLLNDLKVTGLAHIPLSASEKNKLPIIVQFRGYVERTQYASGIGTQRSAEVFARNGFITLAPDFLGYGGSDMPSQDVFEERFQTYMAALQLLASIETLSIADTSRIGIWGHSNGGQIALTVLEATQKAYPTTLWAPVTQPFPYSILYYTNEAEDRGKLLRRYLAKFEQDYDVDLYALTNYLNRISAPVQLHQGSADDAVPIKWSDEFVTNMEALKRDITYYTYPGADHNMQPAWNTVVGRDVEFFRRQFK